MVTNDAGVVVEIPPGALSEPIAITIEPDSETPLELGDAVQVSEVWRFKPEGTSFALPVRITIPYDADAAAETGAPAYYFTLPGEPDRFAEIDDATFADGLATAEVDHFSAGVIVAQAGPPCPAAMTVISDFTVNPMFCDAPWTDQGAVLEVRNQRPDTDPTLPGTCVGGCAAYRGSPLALYSAAVHVDVTGMACAVIGVEVDVTFPTSVHLLDGATVVAEQAMYAQDDQLRTITVTAPAGAMVTELVIQKCQGTLHELRILH